MTQSDSTKIVKQALSFQTPDRLPVRDSYYWPEFVDTWRRHYSPARNISIEDFYGYDLHVAVALEQFLPTRMREIKREGDSIYVDDGWGRIVRTKENSEFCEPVERLLNDYKDLEKIQFDSPSLDSRYVNFLTEVENHKAKGRAVFIKIGGVFIRSGFFRGEMEFLMDLVADQDFAKDIIVKVSDHLLQIGLESLKRAEAYEYGVWIYDDMCDLRGPMFSPDIFEMLFLPVYKRMITSLKAAGARWVMLHSDGNLTPLLDMIVEAGFDGINPVEYSAGMDVVKLMDRYYGKLSFIGGVCNTHILPGGDLDAIRKHVTAIINAGRNGGLVIGTHSVGTDISLSSFEYYRKLVADIGNFSKI
ncbi:MAG: uroporphyrinogen decarboxylase family protein [Kiritimatiellae bacterium]|nr:uroporphyrinogen decarboxylase family protein [Kiritimatiellia bacterium]MDD5521735.1 uroporphyrinogen decarboxylase family protein [Kiritimatiellia bacterium]